MKLIALSDQHGFLPNVPAGDVLIAAGDLCPDVFGGFYARNGYPGVGLQAEWLAKSWEPWAKRQPVSAVAATFGNHDFCGQRLIHPRPPFYVDQLATISGRSFWFSPWSNTFMHWAFMKPPDELAAVYDAIPTGIDVLVSHQPPLGCGDASLDYYADDKKILHVGSAQLLDTVRRVRPAVVICGHIHGGHGKYDVDGIPVYNVSVVNEQYRNVYKATVITI